MQSAIRVSRVFNRSMTAIIPKSIAKADMVGNTPFIASVWIANVSAVSRKIKSPELRRLWKASESRCSCW